MLKHLTSKSILIMILTAVFSISAFADGADWTTKMGEIEYLKHTGTTAESSNEKPGINPVTWFFIDDLDRRFPDIGSYSGYWTDKSDRQVCEAPPIDPNGTKSRDSGSFEITFRKEGPYPVWTAALGDCFEQPDRVLDATKPKDSVGPSTDSGSLGQTSYLITPNSAGDIRIGMTIAEARKALPYAQFSQYEYEGADADFDSIQVIQGGLVLMTLGVNDDDGKIYSIKIWDSRYRLANGVHPGSTIPEAEKIYGKVLSINLVYQDREWADFTYHPEGLRFIVTGGDYSDFRGGDPREQFTTKYKSGAHIYAIEISGRAYVSEPESIEPNYLITSDSVGGIRLGMTIREARNLLKGTELIRGEDEGMDIIEVMLGNKALMYFFAEKGNPNYDAPIDENTKITRITVIDSRYATAAGIHTGMKITEVEREYGLLKEIVLYELDESEHAAFSNQPGNFDFTVAQPGAYREGVRAGIYRRDDYTTTSYNPNAIVSAITVSGNN